MTNVVLTGLARDLARRADEGRPVRIGVIGSGEMGTDLVTQGRLMRGIEISAISTRRPHTAREAITIAYGDDSLGAEADTPSRLTAAIEAGKIAITSNELLVTNPLIDVVIDATGKPGVAADFDLMAMEHGKHVVMMNVEADVTIGAFLKKEADRLGVIYSVGAGDEPSSCMELIEFASALGYTIVSAGKGKNNPLNHDAVPDDYREEAARRNMNPRMLVEFVDGSKTMVEMAAIANATGLVPDVPGMHGPKADRDQLAKVLIPREDGGILSKKGVVDYTIGKGVAPGVFVIVEADASAHHRAHGRPAYRQGAVLQLLPALPSDVAGSAADGGAHHALRQARHGAAADPGRRGLRARQARSRRWRDLRCDRRDLLPLLDDDGRRGPRQGRRAGRPAGGRQGAAGGQEGRAADHRNAAPDPTTRLFALRQRQDQMLNGGA